jgi:hypothetical protein
MENSARDLLCFIETSSNTAGMTKYIKKEFAEIRKEILDDNGKVQWKDNNNKE